MSPIERNVVIILLPEKIIADICDLDRDVFDDKITRTICESIEELSDHDLTERKSFFTAFSNNRLMFPQLALVQLTTNKENVLSVVKYDDTILTVLSKELKKDKDVVLSSCSPN